MKMLDHISSRSLYACLASRNPMLRERALDTLRLTRNFLNWRASIPTHFLHRIGKLGIDQKESWKNRAWAIDLLGRGYSQSALVYLRRILYDTQNDVGLRSHALEQMSYHSRGRLVEEFTALLTNESVDIRFWAAYCLSQQYGVDLTPALENLDHVVAYDHAVPTYFGWHNDREAIRPYEKIHFQHIFLKGMDANDDNYYSPSSVLISPAPEYETFLQDYRVWQEDWKYETQSTSPVTLRVEPDWLATQIKKRWRNADLNIWQPRPKAYSLDFVLVWRKWRLIGGLHQDGYGLVLTGDVQIIDRFAQWYPGIIDPAIPLYSYDWADVGELLELPS